MAQNNPAKVFLARYRAIKVRYESILREMEHRREELTSITAPIRDDPVQSSGSPDRMAEALARIIDAEAELYATKAELDTALVEILEAIASVPDEMQKAVLTLRYVEGLDWIRVAERINYEISNTYIIHGKGLLEVNRYLCRKL